MELEGYMTKKDLYERLGISEGKLNGVMAALHITGQKLNANPRALFFTEADFTAIQEWLRLPLVTTDAVE